MTRRGLLQTAAAATLARAQQGRAAATYPYVGNCTTAERYARGDGIHVYRVDPETSTWTHVQHVGGLVNPSFLALQRDQRCLCSVHGDETYATSFAVDRATGHLTLLNRAETGGRNRVHPAFDPSGRFVIIANYASGNVAVLPVESDGRLADAAQKVALPGQPGPHRIEQASSHPHQVVFDPSGRYALVPDKGLACIFIFRFDAEAGKLTPTAKGSVVARAGSGPRHALSIRHCPSYGWSMKLATPWGRITGRPSMAACVPCRSCPCSRQTIPVRAPAPRSPFPRAAASFIAPIAATTASVSSPPIRIPAC